MRKSKFWLSMAGAAALVAVTGCERRETRTETRSEANDSASVVDQAQERSEQALDKARDAQEHASGEQKDLASAREDVQQEQQDLQEAQQKFAQESQQAQQAQQQAQRQTQESQQEVQTAQQQAAQAQQRASQEQLAEQQRQAEQTRQQAQASAQQSQDRMAQGQQQEPLTVTGQLLSASASAITVSSPDGQPVRLTVDQNTQVFVDGKRSQASAIPQHAQVTASVQESGNGRTARRVEAMSSSGTAVGGAGEAGQEGSLQPSRPVEVGTEPSTQPDSK